MRYFIESYISWKKPLLLVLGLKMHGQELTLHCNLQSLCPYVCMYTVTNLIAICIAMNLKVRIYHKCKHVTCVAMYIAM